MPTAPVPVESSVVIAAYRTTITSTGVCYLQLGRSLARAYIGCQPRRCDASTDDLAACPRTDQQKRQTSSDHHLTNRRYRFFIVVTQSMS
jgi:hypothetical protein